MKNCVFLLLSFSLNLTLITWRPPMCSAGDSCTPNLSAHSLIKWVNTLYGEEIHNSITLNVQQEQRTFQLEVYELSCDVIFCLTWCSRRSYTFSARLSDLKTVTPLLLCHFSWSLPMLVVEHVLYTEVPSSEQLRRQIYKYIYFFNKILKKSSVVWTYEYVKPKKRLPTMFKLTAKWILIGCPLLAFRYSLTCKSEPVNVLIRTLGCCCPAKWTSSLVDGLAGDGPATSWQGGSCQVHSPHMIRNDAQFPDCCSSTGAKILGSFHWRFPTWPQIVSCKEKRIYKRGGIT